MRISERERREIQEAIRAGEDALSRLKEAKRALDSAGGWGIADILGGGNIVGLIKHSRISKAESLLKDSERSLRRFYDELKDVTVLPDLSVHVGGILTLADFFCDGMIADLLVQSKISEGRKKVDRSIREVEEILSRLKKV